MIYIFRMVSNEAEDFFREFQLKDEQTFLDFHTCIQEELSYDASQMASFFISNDNWEKEKEIVLMDMGMGTDCTLMEHAKLKEHIKEDKQKLLYVYDMLSERAFFIEFSQTTNEIEGKDYPVCERSAGAPPAQLIEDELETLLRGSFEDEFDDNDGFQNIRLEDLDPDEI